MSQTFGAEGDPRRVVALESASLEILRGELLCLIGPSGCGKSTLLSLIAGLAEQGVAIVLISSELPEILGMSDRIAVMRAGRITGILSREQATQQTLLDLALQDSSEPAKVR